MKDGDWVKKNDVYLLHKMSVIGFSTLYTKKVILTIHSIQFYTIIYFCKFIQFPG
jgi:hypothetical protein